MIIAAMLLIMVPLLVVQRSGHFVVQDPVEMEVNVEKVGLCTSVFVQKAMVVETVVNVCKIDLEILIKSVMNWFFF